MNLYRHATVAASLIMLVVSLNDPGSNWAIDSRILGLHLQGNLLYWLFSFSVISYIPLMIASLILLAIDLIATTRQMTRRNTFNLLFYSSLNMLALYRFNDWVMSEIF